MKAYMGMDIQIYVFLSLELAGGEWSASRPGRFTPKEGTPVTQWIGGLVALITRLDNMERRKILPLKELKLRPLGRPSRRQSVYPLSHPGSTSSD
jgi:hypothetical protein